MWTIGRVVLWVAQDLRNRGVDAPRLDAELMVAKVLNFRRIDLYLRWEQPLEAAELGAVRAMAERRRKREPLAYILGEREFFGRKFNVDARVLVPRPETELVVELALGALDALGPDAHGVLRALEVGVGSGAIAVTLAAERAGLIVDAVELSEAAAMVARANAVQHGVSERVKVLDGSVYGPVKEERYAVVVSNPPYVNRAEVDGLMPEVSRYEPRLALDGGDDGLDVIRSLLNGARRVLRPNGKIVMEIGDGQGEAARALAETAGLRDVAVKNDLAGRERVLVATAR